MNSALYVGWVRHRRFAEVAHAFRQRVCWCWLDLDELGAALRVHPWWRREGWAPASFRRADYHGDPAVPLAEAVRASVARALGSRPQGAVRLLTQLRTWGVAFNPVSFYYCFHPDGRPAAVLAEITNTPWGERHHYVVAAGDAGVLRGSFAKEFHVSPFQPMGQRYEWTLATPGQRLAVHMENHAGAGRVFDATLALEARPWTTAALVRAWLRQPLMAVKVVANIYWHAFRLWCKRATFHAHPRREVG